MDVYIIQDEEKICTGPSARKRIGVSIKRERLTLPDLSGTPWKYVFIQSTSRIKKLPAGTHFMFCKIAFNLQLTLYIEKLGMGLGMKL